MAPRERCMSGFAERPHAERLIKKFRGETRRPLFHHQHLPYLVDAIGSHKTDKVNTPSDDIAGMISPIPGHRITTGALTTPLKNFNHVAGEIEYLDGNRSSGTQLVLKGGFLVVFRVDYVVQNRDSPSLIDCIADLD